MTEPKREGERGRGGEQGGGGGVGQEEDQESADGFLACGPAAATTTTTADGIRPELVDGFLPATLLSHQATHWIGVETPTRGDHPEEARSTAIVFRLTAKLYGVEALS